MSVQGTLSAAERSIRSVFGNESSFQLERIHFIRILIGNIPYEATEEQLKDIFSEVGPVVSFRLVYDRETGKPKGYGFCEYKDQETALSAMRNLNGYELNGRALRVDNAASEKNKEELKNLQAALGGPPQESPYGIDCEPDKAPEAITKAVASLPPEQMFELMKQMKLCIQNNPNEARTMLLQNPQLAYALLQAQVVMRIVDPQVAMSMLHRANTNVQPLTAAPGNEEFTAPVNNNMDTQSALSFQRFESFLNNPMQVNNNQVAPPSAPAKPTNNFVDTFGLLNAGPRPGAPAPTPAPAPAPVMPGPTQNIRPGRPALLGDRPPIPDRGPSLQPPVVNQLPPRDFDMRDPRTIDPRSMGDRDMRLLPNAGPPPREIRDPRDPRDPRETRDLRDPRDPRDMRDPRLITSDTDSRSGFDQRYRGPDPRYDGRQGPFEARGPPGFDQRPVGAAFDQRPTNAAFDQRSSGAAFDQRPSGGGGFDQRPSGPPFDQRPNMGAGFDQRPAGGGFDQRPAGAPFEQRSGGAGFEPRPATAAFEQRPAAAPFERPAAAFDQRSPVYDQRDPRAAQPPPHSSPGGPPVRPAQAPAMSRPSMPAASVPGAISGASPRPGTPSQVQVSAQDQEKAALIMQVLQLSDQQIAMLPPEQRQSIMVLKDQIARSTQPQ